MLYQYSILLLSKVHNINSIQILHPVCKLQSHNLLVLHSKVNMWKEKHTCTTLNTEVYY